MHRIEFSSKRNEEKIATSPLRAFSKFLAPTNISSYSSSSSLLFRPLPLSLLIGFVLSLGSCKFFKQASPKPEPQAAPLAIVSGFELQPFAAQVERLIQAMEFVGAPLDSRSLESLKSAIAGGNAETAPRAIQEILDPLCLAEIHINPESRVKIARGPAKAELHEQGWRAFLVKVVNEPGITATPNWSSRHAMPVTDPEAHLIPPARIAERWMQLEPFTANPMTAPLGGLKLEYRIIQIYARDAGMREGELICDVGAGTQDLGFRAALPVLFDCQPTCEVTLRVRDVDGKPTMAAFVVKDLQGRIYPYPGKRLEPDLFFQNQVYRRDGETLRLSAGVYEIAFDRGPEYITEKQTVEIPEAKKHRLDFQLKRWIDPNADGWYSGDHHIHASGCAHYKSPTLGVDPPAMMRYVEGEALNVGCVLTWGPAWYHQKQFFTGKTSPLSSDQNIIRYDVEVSGFPSDHCGHLVLLRLNEDDYPGTDEKTQWPTWDLPILQWARAQGAVVGVAHSGWGLSCEPATTLPNYVIPPMDGIGAQEYIVDVTHNAIDFISTVDTPYIWELNVWYHTLNCGFDTKISGETDFPCIYGDKVGLGRSYVKLDTAKTAGRVDFDSWVQGISVGRAYVSDGYSHLMDFTVEGIAPGGVEGGIARIAAPQKVKIRARVASRLEETASPDAAPRQFPPREVPGSPAPRKLKNGTIKDVPYQNNSEVPFWHVERARIAGSRRVPVEVVVNGLPVASKEIEADGSIQNVEFEIPIERSSWVALRILPSAHTNAVKVLVGGSPVRASKKSAQWCLDSIDKLWAVKHFNIRVKERKDAEAAFNHAREVYKKILSESFDDATTQTLSSAQ